VLPAGQQPEWPDRRHLDAVTSELAGLPPLVFAGECELLTERLAAVTRGEAFVLQGGDCAETFDGATADAVRAKLQTLLQMALVLTYGASVPVVKIARMAGQFAKPRASNCPPTAATRSTASTSPRRPGPLTRDGCCAPTIAPRPRSTCAAPSPPAATRT
jgi:3-deoxy-D-arabino-heptulosonate 7-phosphate (DAHP) synthase class II